jgi:hypothetical protein
MKSRGVKFVKDARTYYRVGNYAGLNKARSRRAQTALYQSKVKCIKYLLAVEDSDRTRAAAVRLLRDTLAYFVYDRDDLVAEMQQFAAELGGEVRPPALKWKYRAVEWLFGHNTARQATYVMPRLRAEAARGWDGFLYRLSTAAHAEGRLGIGPAHDFPSR